MWIELTSEESCKSHLTYKLQQTTLVLRHLAMLLVAIQAGTKEKDHGYEGNQRNRRD